MSSNSKVHSSQGNVPFSWENQPGVSKKAFSSTTEDNHRYSSDDENYKQLLPLPPCPPILDSPVKSKIDLQIPLPPCPYQSKVVSRSNSSTSRKGGIKRFNEDPFFAAYKECTKTKTRFTTSSTATKSGGFRIFSCKNSCGVKEDSLIKSHHHRQQQKQVYSPNILRERVNDLRGK